MAEQRNPPYRATEKGIPYRLIFFRSCSLLHHTPPPNSPYRRRRKGGGVSSPFCSFEHSRKCRITFLQNAIFFSVFASISHGCLLVDPLLKDHTSFWELTHRVVHGCSLNAPNHQGTVIKTNCEGLLGSMAPF